MRNQLRILLIPAAVSLITTLTMPVARAQDEAAGRVLFDDAMTLLNRGQISDACPKFEESLRQSYNINAQYFLADCWEKLGKTASAWTTFLTVTSRAREAGDDKRERAARKRADALEKRLVRFKINVASEVDGLEVRRNGMLVGRAMWGTTVPVDPGSYEFSASAPGYVTFETTLNASSPGRVFEVNIPELSRKSVPIASSPVRSSPPEPVVSRRAVRESEAREAPSNEILVKRPSETPAKSDDLSGWRTAGWVAGGVGVATMVTGGIVALLAKRSYDNAKSSYEKCQTDECDTTEINNEKNAISRANLGGGLFIGGAVLTAAAGALLIWSYSSTSSEPSSSQSSVSLRVSPMGLSLEGRL